MDLSALIVEEKECGPPFEQLVEGLVVPEVCLCQKVLQWLSRIVIPTPHLSSVHDTIAEVSSFNVQESGWSKGE